MGITKTDLFTEAQNELAICAKAFSHPARVAILQFLLNKNECINSDLVTELGLAQATISQHLKELKSIGLIKGTVEGTSMNYCIDQENWIAVKLKFDELFSSYSACKKEDCC